MVSFGNKKGQVYFEMKSILSKSKFIRGLQCPRSLWLYVHMYELIPPPDEARKARFHEGKEVGRIATGLFPGGKEIVYKGSSLQEKASLTTKWIEEGVSTIYEATFVHDGVAVMVDILHRGEEGWEIYEVKGSTQVKDIYIDDVAIQFYVARGAGLPILKASLVYLNNEYVRDGDLNLSELFVLEDLTRVVLSRQVSIPDAVSRLKETLESDEPEIDIGLQCDNYEYCGFEGRCWAHVPTYSIFNISRIGKKKWDLYQRGIVDLKDIPADYELSESQRQQILIERKGNEVLEKDEIREFLDKLSYPLYFLDFETVMPAIPPFDGTRPYQQIPFQFSLHSLAHVDGELKHEEFLGTPGLDPRQEIAGKLAELIPKDACVLAYNMGFEKGVITSLAENFPELREQLMRIHDNIHDLMTLFQKKHYYTKDMQGRYSIKAVLPALVPELSYEGMAVSDGGEASGIYRSLELVEDAKEVEKIRQDLLAYCRLDTLGMVKLLGKLQEAVS